MKINHRTYHIYSLKIFKIIKSKVLIFAIILINQLINFNNFIQAQPKDTIRNIIEDGWIEKMNSKIGVDLSLNNAFEIFKVQTPTLKLIIYPNTKSNFRLSLNYKFLSISYQFAPDFIPGNDDNEIKGKTNSYSIGTDMAFKHLLFSVTYSKINGFYLRNTEDFIHRYPGDPYYQFPDLFYKRIKITTGFNPNSKYSLKSMTTSTERQLKSALSVIPNMSFVYYVIDDKSSTLLTQKSNNYESFLNVNFCYTYVLRENYYLSLSLSPGMGYLFTKLTTRLNSGDNIINQHNALYRWEGKIGIGYNGRKYYTGLYAFLSKINYKQENTTASNTEARYLYHFFVGIRFNAPEAINRRFSNIVSK